MGRRGLVLILFGIAWLIYGSAFFLLGEMGTGGNFLHEKMPPEVQGAIWCVAGIIAITASAMRRGRRSDTFGYLAAFLPPMAVAASSFFGAIGLALTGDYVMAAAGAFGVVLWGDFATIVAVCASWPEEPALPGGER